MTDDQLRFAIRSEYDIPDELGDTAAERVLSSALSDIVLGDVAGAEERLRREFFTVCERESPEEQATGAGHPAACHLHDTEDSVEEWEWASVD